MILVTGATGLLGSHVVIDLLKSGATVRGLTRNQEPPEIFNLLLDFYSVSSEERSRLEWVTGDITDITTLDSAFDNVNEVYHCAALVSFLKSDFQALYDINVTGTQNVVNMCLHYQVEKLCHVSSTAAIGKKGNEQLVVEDGEWIREMNATVYSKTKFLAEREAWRGAEEGLNVCIVNPCVILGPGDWNQSSCVMFKTVHDGLKFYPNGGTAFVDARDVSQIMLRLMEESIYSERFLVVGENLRFKEVFDILAKHFGVKGPTIRTPKWLTGVAWRIDWLLSIIPGRKRKLSREMARNAQSLVAFSNEKIKSRLDYSFHAMEEMAAHSVPFFKA